MDLKLVKQKLNDLNAKPSPKREKVDYSKIIWKPKVGKHVIRIVPSAFDKNNPFKEVFLHYGFQKFPIFALTNWGEKDPIVEFASELRKTSERENWLLAKKIEPKMRIFVPVLVRGEEEMGTRLWEMGKSLYNQFLQIADDEDYGDYTDIVSGRDFTVEATKTEVAGKEATKCTIRIKPKTSPLLSDKYSQDQIDKLLNEQPDVLAINRKFTFDQLKSILNDWLSGGETSKESSNDASENETLIGNSERESKESRLEKLFGEED